MANLYFDEAIESATVESSVTVTGDEGRHAVRVSRLRVGEQTVVGNGRGLLAQGVVTAVDRDSFTLRIESVRQQPEGPAPRLVLVQALAKGDRDERAVEQATEFGVDAVIPWQAERSVSRWGGEKSAKGVAKWSRIAREASKQSMRGWIPETLSPTGLAGLCELAGTATVVVLHPRGERPLSEAAKQWSGGDGPAEIYLVVGPEGGLSDGELDELEAAGAHICVLGSTVLRTSSAGPAAIAVLNTVFERW